MPSPSVDLLRDGLNLKVSHVKRALRGYVRDRVSQATGQLSSYAVAAGLFAVAAILALGAAIVGLVALFRWVEITYGEFQAFAAVGGLLVLLAAVCVLAAAFNLKKKAAQRPSLPSRLRVAVASPPIPDGTLQRAAKETLVAAGSRATHLDAKTASLFLGALVLGGYTIARGLGARGERQDR